MAAVFVDANYLIAALLDRDRLHSEAVRLSAELSEARFVTSTAVLVEVLNHLSKMGSYSRGRAVALYNGLHADPSIEVVSFDDALIQRSVQLYASRSDKRYSLTDCISMIICIERGIRDVLTQDHNFEQEGFTILMSSERRT